MACPELFISLVLNLSTKLCKLSAWLNNSSLAAAVSSEFAEVFSTPFATSVILCTI